MRKDWNAGSVTVEKQSVDVENQLQSLDATYLTVKRTQEAVDDLMLRVERRINEVAEVQRLAEEQFRQEWTTFKADDQKRWTPTTPYPRTSNVVRPAANSTGLPTGSPSSKTASRKSRMCFNIPTNSIPRA